MTLTVVGHVVGDLPGLGERGTDVISPDGSETRAVSEVYAGKATIGWMLGDVYVLQSELSDGRGALNGKTRTEECVGKPEAELIQEVLPDDVVVGNEEAPVVFAV